jgi:hypothetical protein
VPPLSSHLAESLRFAEFGNGVRRPRRLGLSFRQNLELSANDHVQRIAGIAGPEENFVRDETASTDATQKRLDFLRQ